MKRLLFIINPKAGRTAIRNDLFEIIMVFSQAGYEVVTYPTQGPEDAERKVRVDGEDYDLIVCAGGDGTLDNTVCGYSKMGHKKVPLGYIPVGTTNDFARSLRISRKPIEAANQIVNGKCTKVDIGQFADKSFIYIAAFGIFTDVSYNTNQSLKKAIGHSAYIIEGIKNIGNYKGFNLTAQFDEKVITGKYLYGMVTNTLSVGGFKLRGAKHVVLDDGKFDCLFIKMPSTPDGDAADASVDFCKMKLREMRCSLNARRPVCCRWRTGDRMDTRWGVWRKFEACGDLKPAAGA